MHKAHIFGARHQVPDHARGHGVTADASILDDNDLRVILRDRPWRSVCHLHTEDGVVLHCHSAAILQEDAAVQGMHHDVVGDQHWHVGGLQVQGVLHRARPRATIEDEHWWRLEVGAVGHLHSSRQGALAQILEPGVLHVHRANPFALHDVIQRQVEDLDVTAVSASPGGVDGSRLDVDGSIYPCHHGTERHLLASVIHLDVICKALLIELPRPLNPIAGACAVIGRVARQRPGEGSAPRAVELRHGEGHLRARGPIDGPSGVAQAGGTLACFDAAFQPEPGVCHRCAISVHLANHGDHLAPEGLLLDVDILLGVQDVARELDVGFGARGLAEGPLRGADFQDTPHEDVACPQGAVTAVIERQLALDGEVLQAH
mmetsp:Transcript_30733/g.73278  ORF Transcript_30733/g.73278 Transcript_30733/m.73278 type:complete len:374 (-) Transcript_30733:586-1707(-)